jgi:hypothetical protein
MFVILVVTLIFKLFPILSNIISLKKKMILFILIVEFLVTKLFDKKNLTLFHVLVGLATQGIFQMKNF